MQIDSGDSGDHLNFLTTKHFWGEFAEFPLSDKTYVKLSI